MPTPPCSPSVSQLKVLPPPLPEAGKPPSQLRPQLPARNTTSTWPWRFRKHPATPARQQGGLQPCFRESSRSWGGRSPPNKTLLSPARGASSGGSPWEQALLEAAPHAAGQPWSKGLPTAWRCHQRQGVSAWLPPRPHSRGPGSLSAGKGPLHRDRLAS